MVHWLAALYSLYGSLMRLIGWLIDMIKFDWLIAVIGCWLAASIYVCDGVV